MPLVVPGVCRFTYEGTYAARPWAVIADMRIDTTGTSTDRPDAILDQATILWNQWWADLRGIFVNELAVTAVSWVDLDELDGSVGRITTTTAHPAPLTGTSTGTGVAPNTSFLVQKLIDVGRGRRNGRSYWTGFDEAQTPEANPGNLSDTFRASLQGSFTTWLGNINQDGGVVAPIYDSRLCVVHITAYDDHTPPRPIAGNSRDVSSLVVASRLATQRRRLRG